MTFYVDVVIVPHLNAGKICHCFVLLELFLCTKKKVKAKWLKTFVDPDQHWNLKIKEGNNIMPRQLTYQAQCSLPWLTITSLQKYLRNALKPWRSSVQRSILSNQGSAILHLVPGDLHTGQQLLSTFFISLRNRATLADSGCDVSSVSHVYSMHEIHLFCIKYQLYRDALVCFF